MITTLYDTNNNVVFKIDTDKGKLTVPEDANSVVISDLAQNGFTIHANDLERYDGIDHYYLPTSENIDVLQLSGNENLQIRQRYCMLFVQALKEYHLPQHLKGYTLQEE